jgi:Lecithin retinol acyltransferase
MFHVAYRGKSYPLGAHLKIRRPSGIDHHVIVVGGSLATFGPVMVVDNAKGAGVSRRRLEEVAGGDPVEVVALPQSEAHANKIVERAYSQSGSRYDLLSRNCEHFAHWCFSGTPRSLQLQGYGMLAAVLVGLVIVGKSR